MGEAKHRRSKPPTAWEMADRFTKYFVELYPRPLRGYVRFSLKLIAGTALVFAFLYIAVELVAAGKWLFHH